MAFLFLVFLACGPQALASLPLPDGGPYQLRLQRDGAASGTKALRGVSLALEVSFLAPEPDEDDPQARAEIFIRPMDGKVTGPGFMAAAHSQDSLSEGAIRYEVRLTELKLGSRVTLPLQFRPLGRSSSAVIAELRVYGSRPSRGTASIAVETGAAETKNVATSAMTAPTPPVPSEALPYNPRAVPGGTTPSAIVAFPENKK